MTRIKAFAPATIANLGVGFDVLGMAVDTLGDYVTVEKSTEQGVEIVEITGDDGRLPKDPVENTAAVAAQSVLNAIDSQDGVRIWLEKGLPLASGMGSSAASAVAAAVAVNKLYDEPLTRDDLLPCVLDAEEKVSGRHADNVAPCLFGGIVLVTGETVQEIHRLPIPDGIYVSLVKPEVEVKTKDARSVLPKTVPLSALVYQTGVIAELIHALHQGNVHLMAQSMQRDAVVEPARSILIPHLNDARESALLAGALVTVISGSGPTLCSLCVTSQDAELVSRSLVEFYEGKGIAAQGYHVLPNRDGATIVSD